MKEENVTPIDNNENMWSKIDGEYIKLESEKAKNLLIMDWKIEVIEKFIDEKETKRLGREVKKKQMEFSANVLSEDGRPVKKVFTTTSINCMKKLREKLEDKTPSVPVSIRIKKIGEGVKTIYDVELN